MSENINNTDKGLNFIEKFGNYIKSNGLHNTLLTMMMLFLVGVVVYAIANPSTIVEKIEEIKNKNHTEAVMKRINSEPEIREALVSLKVESSADRVFLMETHNGGTNLSNLPFLYVDLTYAEPKSLLSWMEDEYKNVRLSRYPWASHMFSLGYWFGSVEDIKEVDPELYYRLYGEDVKYIGMELTYGTYNPSGVLGIVYCGDDIPTESEIHRCLAKYSSMLSTLLNNE